MEDEPVYDNSTPVPRHPLGHQVYSSSPCISFCPNTAGANAISPPAAALY